MNKLKYPAAIATGCIFALAISEAKQISETAELNASAAAKGAAELDVLNLPESLPAAVESLQDNAVAIGAIGVIGSGIALDERRILTAGHVLYDDDEDKLDPPGSQELASFKINDTGMCGDVIVHSTSTEAARFDTAGVARYGASVDVYRSTGTTDHGFDEPDLALLQSSWELPFDTQPVPIAETKAAVGEPVYFINYQPDDQGMHRSPNAGRLSDYQLEQGYDEPALFAGFVVGGNAGGDTFHVATMKSYGMIQDSEARGGGSGGLVANGNGEVVGVLSAVYTEPFDAASMPHNFGVAIKNAPASQIDVSIVQPVTQEYINDLNSKLSSEPPCIP